MRWCFIWLFIYMPSLSYPAASLQLHVKRNTRLSGSRCVYTSRGHKSWKSPQDYRLWVIYCLMSLGVWLDQNPSRGSWAWTVKPRKRGYYHNSTNTKGSWKGSLILFVTVDGCSVRLLKVKSWRSAFTFSSNCSICL